MANLPLVLTEPTKLLGEMRAERGGAALDGGKWYVAPRVGAAVVWNFPIGALAEAKWVAVDFLLEGRYLAKLQLALYEPKQAGGVQRVFRFEFGLLGECSARLRVPLEAVDQNRWSFAREGACLKRMAFGDRVDLAKVDQMTVTVQRKADAPVRLCMTAPRASVEAPELITRPLLPKGPLLDELGQWAQDEWPGKTRGVAECTARLKKQLEGAAGMKWPDRYGTWGGDARVEKLAEGKGFFGKHFDGKRWWLADPEGRPFFSVGMDDVRAEVSAATGLLESALTAPPAGQEYDAARRGRPGGRRGGSVDFLVANLIRAFGAEGWHDAWGRIALAHLRAWGFNTVGNWSEERVASAARFPYVLPLRFEPRATPLVFRDFPDVFSPTLEEDAAAFARQLRVTRDDPALIGYFLMNEPTWGFASETVAAGMLYTHESSHARDVFATFLAEKYKSDAALAAAWKMPGLTLSRVASGKWSAALTPEARPDCAAFSTRMVEHYFKTLSGACRKVDPNHLNLGARYHTTPPPWALAGMTSFDVFSINCYAERVPARQLERITEALKVPVMIGEYHFGALDVGLPASGLVRVASQADRGRAFRYYTENAAAIPQCVGVHYFTMYDESALGRFDGENYNIGFLDICNQPYEALGAAARATCERIYGVARGEVEAFAEPPKYLPKLF